jgi:hypothetical protein
MQGRLGALGSIALMLVTCGCGDAGSPAPDLGTTQDLAVRDAPSGLSCAMVLACVNGCTTASTCAPGCIAQGSQAALGYFSPLQACAQPRCYYIDGGTPPCESPTSAACTTCINASCGNELNACLSH